MKPVYPEGPEDAKLVIVGEAPGVLENANGRPFIGPSGDLLFGLGLNKVGIRREQCLLTNTYWELPPNENWSKIQNPTKYMEQNWELISSHERHCIMLVGGQALHYFTGMEPSHRTNIQKWRGSILRDNSLINTGVHTATSGRKPPVRQTCWLSETAFLPTRHPAFILREWSALPLLRHDCRRAKEILINPSLTAPERTIIHAGNSSFYELLAALKDYTKEAILSFDIETMAQTITCIGIGKSPTHAVVIPLTGPFSWNETALLLEVVKECLEGSSLKIGQNLDYDTQYLHKVLGIGVRNVWMDTMVAHSVIMPEYNRPSEGMGHDLATLTSLYTYQPYYKDMRKETNDAAYSNTQWQYNGLDCCVTWEIGMQLAAELKATKTLDFYHTLSLPTTKTLIRMETRGVAINDRLRKSRKKDLEASLGAVLSAPELQGVNPNSPAQIKQWFEGALPPSQRPKTTSEQTLVLLKNRLIEKKPFIATFVDAVLRARKQRKLISTYLNPKLGADGRLHTTFKTSTTSTGRLSSTKDPFGGGMNLQNVPKSQRDWIVPDSGFIFWACDASQIEARIVAWLTADGDLINGFLEGRDFHAENAARLFGVPIDKVRSTIAGTEFTFRDVGKASGTHAVNYRVGWNRLKDNINELVPEYPFSAADAKRYLQESIREPIKRWWAELENRLKNNRVVYTPSGRRRVFLDRWPDRVKIGEHPELFRNLTAHWGQSTAADHINSCLSRVERDLPKGSELLLQAHDELAGQCRPEVLRETYEIVTTHMESPLPIDYKGEPLVVPAEFSYGPSWGQCNLEIN